MECLVGDPTLSLYSIMFENAWAYLIWVPRVHISSTLQISSIFLLFVLHYSMASETMASRLSYDPMVSPFVLFDEIQTPRSRRHGSSPVSQWRGKYKGVFTKPWNRKCKHHYLILIFIVRATERCNRKPINRRNIALHLYK